MKISHGGKCGPEFPPKIGLTEAEDYEVGAGVPDKEHWCEEHNKQQYFVSDPFMKEVYNKEVMLWLCEDCEYESFLDT